MANKLILIAIGIAIGAIGYHYFLKPEVEIKTKTKIKYKTDTTYQKLYEELQMEVKQSETLNDSIDYYQKLYQKELGNIKLIVDTVYNDKPFLAPLRRFSGLKPSLYGDLSYNAIVAGELLDLRIKTDFDIPTVTNTVTTEKITTKTIIQKGIFIGAGMSDQLNYHLGLAYLGNGFMVNANYTPRQKTYQDPVIQADVKINLFSLKK